MLTRIDKAIVAGLGAAASVVAGASSIDSFTGEVGLIALVAGIVVGIVTFAVPNKTA